MSKTPKKDIVYLIKGGKQVMPVSEFFAAAGSPDLVNPTHNFELLKEARLKRFKKAEQSFIEQLNINKVETSDFELNCHYYAWLKNELKVIEGWMQDKYPNGKQKPHTLVAEQIEILKYKQWVEIEMENTEIKINPPSQTEPQKKKKPQNDDLFPSNISDKVKAAQILKNELDKLGLEKIKGSSYSDFIYAVFCEVGFNKQQLDQKEVAQFLPVYFKDEKYHISQSALSQAKTRDNWRKYENRANDLTKRIYTECA